MDRWDVIAIRTHLPPPERTGPRGRGPRMIHPTQAEFADMLGVSTWVVRHWEQGVTDVPDDMAVQMRALRDEHDRILQAVRKSAETLNRLESETVAEYAAILAKRRVKNIETAREILGNASPEMVVEALRMAMEDAR